jgi:thiosulfate/3-mercaptopyruvate sulfurtransferase
LAGHLPDAVNIWVLEATTLEGHVRRVASAQTIERLLSDAGIDQETTVVLYGERGGLDAAYLFWALEYYGHPDLQLLDGGIEGYVRQGLPLSDLVPKPSRKKFVAEPCETRRVRGPWLAGRLRAGDPEIQVVDNRSLPEYRGEDVFARRGGHIPGARLLSWDRALNPDLTLKTPEELAALYREGGLVPERTVVNYCQTGVRSAHAYFTQRLLGFHDPRVYDASWAEWANDERYPVESGLARRMEMTR